MIVLNQENRLGKKAYILMLLKALVPPIVILVIALVLIVSSRGIIDLAVVFFGNEEIVSYYVNYAVLLVFALFAVSLIMSVINSRISYRRYTFTFEQFGLHLKRGMVRTSEVTIPYRQMQDIQIERGFFHQLTGTCRLVVDSGGNEDQGTRFRPDEEADIVMDPIDRGLAEEIRLMLQRKIGVQVVEGEREADREAMEQSAVEGQGSRDRENI